MNTTSGKMDWFVREYENGTLDYCVSKTGKKKGTIVIPTGGGKSGKIYADIVRHIETCAENEKMVFNISAPYLNLESQLLNDLISCMKNIFPERISRGEFMFFMNSSSDGGTYETEHLNTDTMYFSEIDKFRDNKSAKFAIVASCHKSLYKFGEKVDELNGYATTLSYLDEAHMVISESKKNIRYSGKRSIDDISRTNTLKDICKCTYVYAFSATPDKYVTEIINQTAGESDTQKNIIEIPARELIGQNKILPANAFYQWVYNDEGDRITSDICLDFMRMVQKDNPDIKHKILVTCSSTDHLNTLRDSLNSKFKVFSTCSRDGGMSMEGDEMEIIDPVSFVREVDSWEDNCFVLHIKQLTQGIDINTLTDCIIYNSSKLDDGVKRTIIQTIGRVLRPLRNERGKCIDERIKKYGNVLFIMGCADDTNFKIVRKETENFLTKYYGLDGFRSFTYDPHHNYGDMGKVRLGFGFGNSHFSDEYVDYRITEIEELKIDMEEYIRNNIYPRHKKLSKVFDTDDAKEMAIDSLKERYSHCNGYYNTGELFNDTEFMSEVNDILKKYDIM